MKLRHIELDTLKETSLNVRKHGGENIDDLVASIRALGVIQPLLVRPNCEGFEVIAGGRRLKACRALAGEDFDLGSIPCAVLEDGDDATAIEASLAENAARLPMDELDQYAAFAALVDQGKTVDEIAASFGVSERLVKQRLALAGLHPPILSAYRNEGITAQTMRHLTLATKKQQRAWFKLFRSKEECAPTGHALKAWLFGGADIDVSAALFPLDDYKGAIKSDLFGDEQYFTDGQEFWTLQNTAIAAKVAEYREAGWSDAVVLDVGEYFSTYDKANRPKEDGGKVYVSCAANGEVEFHEGWLTTTEARRLDRAKAKADGTYEPPVRPELTKAARTYVDLHRHATVRTELLKHPSVALRLVAAHVIAGSHLWHVEPDPQNTARRVDIEASLNASKAEKDFAKQRKAVLKLLDFDESRFHLVEGGSNEEGIGELFEKLGTLTDKQVLRVLTFVMAETLACGSPLIDALGAQLDVDLASWWSPDDTFFDLLRDKQVINAILSEVAGKTVADGNVTSTAKVQKDIIKNSLSGTGREKVENWLPRYMTFPMRGYTERFS